jgi:hypothetical protein
VAGALRKLVGGLLVELGERLRGREGNPGFLRDAYGEPDNENALLERIELLEPIVSAKGRAMLERRRRAVPIEKPEPPLAGSLEARGFVRRVR